MPRAALFPLLLVLCGCVPRAQYNTLLAEREAYRTEARSADSANNQRLLSATDSLQALRENGQKLVRQIEELSAANRATNERLADLTQRYESILEQNRTILTDNGADANLQQQLRDRSAELEARQVSLERRERELAVREENLSSLGEMRSAQPSTESSPRGTSPVDPVAQDEVRLTTLQEELRQLMLALTDEGYLLRRPRAGTLELVLGGTLTFADSAGLTPTGQRILRRLAATLKNYPGMAYTVVGHAESVEGDALLAYRNSSERAASVALQLAEFGVDPGTILAAGKGFYGSGDVRPLSGLDAERRTEILIQPGR